MYHLVISHSYGKYPLSKGVHRNKNLQDLSAESLTEATGGAVRELCKFCDVC